MTTADEDSNNAKQQQQQQQEEKPHLSMNLIKSLNRSIQNGGRANSSASGSSGSNGEGNGHQSDNSALVSVGNTSFGFNFDSEDGNSSPPNSERNCESDSDGGNGNCDAKRNHEQKREQANGQVTQPQDTSVADSHQQGATEETAVHVPQHQQSTTDTGDSNSVLNQEPSSAVLTAGARNSPVVATAVPSSHNMAADAAVANLHYIATAYIPKEETKGGEKNPEDKDNDNNCVYNPDNEGCRSASLVASLSAQHRASMTSNGASDNANNDDDDDDDDEEDDDGRPKKKKRLNDKKREERNAREKERSFRISKQINELRALLSSGGVIVPKGTKSSVLTEAANYIRMLQQHQYRSEIDRHQLVQQIQMIGGGAHGQQAAQAIRHVAAKNGVWSLGNFGGVPPKSAMGYYEPGSNGGLNETKTSMDPIQQTKIEDHEYRSVFNNCAVGMAIASMGGAFIDCNQLFCKLSNYTKQEVCALTIFNLTARQDLQHAFDLISQLISPPVDAPHHGPQPPVVLRGAMNNRHDLGLGVALVKGEDGIAKFFCVTLIKNPASPFDDSRPIPATIELIQGTPSITRDIPKDAVAEIDSAPAFTTG